MSIRGIIIGSPLPQHSPGAGSPIGESSQTSLSALLNSSP